MRGGGAGPVQHRLRVRLHHQVLVVHLHMENMLHRSVLRYIEKSAGKFVGDSQCEKLPVEVRDVQFAEVYSALYRCAVLAAR